MRRICPRSKCPNCHELLGRQSGILLFLTHFQYLDLDNLLPITSLSRTQMFHANDVSAMKWWSQASVYTTSYFVPTKPFSWHINLFKSTSTLSQLDNRRLQLDTNMNILSLLGLNDRSEIKAWSWISLRPTLNYEALLATEDTWHFNNINKCRTEVQIRVPHESSGCQ